MTYLTNAVQNLCSIVTKPATLKWFWLVLNEKENTTVGTVGSNKIIPNFSNFGVRFRGTVVYHERGI